MAVAAVTTWHRRHAEDVAAARAKGDASALKRLYVDLGAYLEDDYRHDPRAVPQLSLPRTAARAVALLGSGRGPVLDAGCGPQPAVSRALAARGMTPVGLDIATGVVRLARTLDGIRGVSGDLEALPFRDRAFAAVVCEDAIEHVPDDAAAMRELARVSRGSVVIATPNRHAARTLLRRAVQRLRRRPLPARAYFAADSHLREYTWRELERLMWPVLTVSRRAGLPGLRRLARMIVVAGRPG